MVQSIRNLLWYAWKNLVAALGTTTLSILLFSFVLPLVIFILKVVVGWREERRAGKSVKGIIKGSILSWQTLIPSTIYLLAWTGLLGWSLSATAYRDHVALLGRIRALVSQNEALKNETQHLKSVPPQTITRTVPAPDKCWMQNITIPPPKSFIQAVSSNETIIFCNHKVKAPLMVAVEYDQNPVAGAGFAFQGARIVDAMEYLTENKYFGKFNSPSILPYELFIVTVHGGKEKAPSAVKLTVNPINPDRQSLPKKEN